MKETSDIDSMAQLVLPSTDLTKDMEFFTKLGFRLDHIFPSDDPAVAVMSGHSLTLRLDKDVTGGPATFHILTDHPESIAGSRSELVVAPNGTKIKIMPKTYKLNTPQTQHKFEVRKLQNNDPWVIGRAGMLYRDLIPDRLGGSIIASHINIPDGGPVPDMVHYHTIGFQLIFCYRGWVKLVYEDQGPPFILEAGDCVTQPPEIRHRVLEASDNLEVIEIGVPSDHMTTIDHEMDLPNKPINPQRTFQGQQFCHHIASKADWSKWKIPGFEYRDTGINQSTNGVAGVHVARVLNPDYQGATISNKADILFTFVMKGSFKLVVNDQSTNHISVGDAYVIPPDLKYQMQNCSSDLELLQVSLPGDSKTTIELLQQT
ncbi:MAG: cupin domain-containing protein [Cyclobacteriaceae bacterium]